MLALRGSETFGSSTSHSPSYGGKHKRQAAPSSRVAQMGIRQHQVDEFHPAMLEKDPGLELERYVSCGRR